MFILRAHFLVNLTVTIIHTHARSVRFRKLARCAHISYVILLLLQWITAVCFQNSTAKLRHVPVVRYVINGIY